MFLPVDPGHTVVCVLKAVAGWRLCRKSSSRVASLPQKKQLRGGVSAAMWQGDCTLPCDGCCRDAGLGWRLRRKKRSQQVDWTASAAVASLRQKQS